MGTVIGVDHIGIVVNNVDEAISMYKTMFDLHHIETTIFAEEGLKVAVLDAFTIKIELLESISPHSKIAKFSDTRGQGVHHIAFQVKNLHEYVKILESKGNCIINKTVSQGINNTKVAFLHPRHAGNVLIEFCEK